MIEIQNVSQTVFSFNSNESKTCCTLMLFLLKEAVIVNEWAGLRPGRSEVRLERDHVRDKYGNKLEVCIKYMPC